MTTMSAPEPEKGIARKLADAHRKHLRQTGSFGERLDSLPSPLPTRRRQVCFDTEFIDDGKTIELVSIGLVDDEDRFYYAVNKEVDQERILRHAFLRDQVWPKLPLRELETGYALTLREGEYDRNTIIPSPGQPVEIWVNHELNTDHFHSRTKDVIRKQVLEFLVPQGWDAAKDGPAVDLWAWFAAYDHVVLAQLFGPMVALPPGVPMRTGDLAQEAARLGVPKESMPPQDEAFKHHALADADHDWVIKRHLDHYAWENRRV